MFLVQMFRPLLFLFIVTLYTPDEGADPKSYFEDNLRLIYALLAFYVGLSVFLVPGFIHMKLLAVLVILAIAWSKYKPLIYLLALLRFGLVAWLVIN